MEQLTLIEKIGANYVLLELNGPVNSYTMTELQTKMSSYIEDTNVVLDCAGVTSIDSTGMGVIMASFNDAQEFGTKLYFMNPSFGAKKAIDATGFADTFLFVHSVTEVI